MKLTPKHRAFTKSILYENYPEPEGKQLILSTNRAIFLIKKMLISKYSLRKLLNDRYNEAFTYDMHKNRVNRYVTPSIKGTNGAYFIYLVCMWF